MRSSFEAQFRQHRKIGSLNMTPVIDIVFLLMIFFLLVCRFIESADHAVSVPDGCDFAQDSPEADSTGVTLTVLRRPGRTTFLVAGQELPASAEIPASARTDRLAALLDARLAEVQTDRKVVTLRIDKDIPFAQAQYALAAVARSTATDVRLAVLRGTTPPEAGRAVK